MTMDNGMDVSPSWEELRGERDALAAHVELLSAVVDKMRTVTPENLERLTSNAAFVLRDAPTTSLDRLKAEWQAEALESLAADAHPHIRIWLKDEAKKLHSRAEGGK